MTKARCHIVPPDGDPTLHLISRCVRRAFLMGDDADLGALDHRKVWIANRLGELTGFFAVEVMTYALMSNHFHLVLRMRRSWVKAWTDEEVVRRWVEVFPSRKFSGPHGDMVKTNHIASLLEQPEKVAKLRIRLGDCGWLMKALKEPISRLANQEDKARGAFWEGRYKSIHLEDEAAVVACMLYVDANPLRAGVTKTIEAQTDVGLAQRLAEKQQRFKAFWQEQENIRLAVKDEGVRARFKPVAILTQRCWLKPMAGSRGPEGKIQPGFLHPEHQLTLEAYIHLLEATTQRKKDGKAHLTPECAGTLARLGLPSKEEAWDRLVRQASGKGRCLKVAGNPPPTDRAAA